MAVWSLESGDAADGLAQGKLLLRTSRDHPLTLAWKGAAVRTPEVLRGAAEHIHQVTGAWPTLYATWQDLALAHRLLPEAPLWEAIYGDLVTEASPGPAQTQLGADDVPAGFDDSIFDADLTVRGAVPGPEVSSSSGRSDLAGRILEVAVGELQPPRPPLPASGPPALLWSKYTRFFGRGPELWGADFVSWVCTQAGVPLDHGYCPRLRKALESAGRWHEGRAEPGDLVFLRWGDDDRIPEHVGIVESVKEGNLQTIEGGSPFPGEDQDVSRRSRDTSLVLGYGRLSLRRAPRRRKK